MSQRKIAAPAAEVLARLASVSTATLTMQLLKRGYKRCFLNGVGPLHAGTRRFAAPAFTLRNIPVREDVGALDILAHPDYPQRRAIETTLPGHALVIDACRALDAGTIGDILAERLHRRGVAAVVTDGALRDTPELAGIDLAMYCAARVAPASLAALYAVELQVPIGCAGVAVFPGDIMVGDGDGVVVIPRALAEEIAADAPEQERYERFVREKVAEGRSITGLYPASEDSRAEYENWTGE